MTLQLRALRESSPICWLYIAEHISISIIIIIIIIIIAIVIINKLEGHLIGVHAGHSIA